MEGKQKISNQLGALTCWLYEGTEGLENVRGGFPTATLWMPKAVASDQTA